MSLRRRLGVVAAVAVVLSVVCCGGGAAAFFLGGLNPGPDKQAAGALSCGGASVDLNGPPPAISSLGDKQIHNAAVIVSVGQQLGVPPRGWVIAVATALQESALTNLPNLGPANDHDSLGLFQQRPSQGWGTPDQLLDPAYASRKFYEHLLAVPGWQTMALTDAAQRVQRSAYPDAYAKHEPLATVVVNALTNGAARAVGAVVNVRCVDPGEISASGWTVPVKGPIVSGFRPPDRPTHNGVDIAAPKGTIIHAAAAGVVTVVRCQAHLADGTNWGCDRDGGVFVLGCGWYVEILHAGNIITRYCHQLRQPDVVVGQRVAAGQPIGVVGDTGNSSGPHCHFEVHVGGDNSAAGAVNPVPFMNQVGAPLGDKA